MPTREAAQFLAIAEAAKRDCPVSKALAGTTITLQARLISAPAPPPPPPH